MHSRYNIKIKTKIPIQGKHTAKMLQIIVVCFVLTSITHASRHYNEVCNQMYVLGSLSYSSCPSYTIFAYYVFIIINTVTSV